MRLKDRVGRLESNLVTLEQDTMSDIVKLENFTGMGKSMSQAVMEENANEKRIRSISSTVANEVLLIQTATCHICGKRDFMDNLADVGWMEDFTFIGSLHAHPSCAHIKRSDDGKGWVRAKK